MKEKKYTANNIQSLEGMEHVRLRPNMYFEDCFVKKNLNPLVIDALCHAIDEYFDGNCNEILIKTDKNFFHIQYNAGMSLEKSYDMTKAECIMTKIGACSNEKKHLEIGTEFWRFGMAMINAVTEKCELNIVYNKQKGHFIFEKGNTLLREISFVDDLKNSTQISFEMSKEIFGNLEFNFGDLQLKLDSLREKLPDLKIQFNKL